MSRWRISLILSCTLLAAGSWLWAMQRTTVPTDVPLSALAAWGGLALLASLVSNEPRGRRLQAAAGLAWIASAWALHALQLAMSPEAWEAAGRPARPDGAALLQRLADGAAALVTLRWVPGVSEVHSAGVVVAMPLCLLTLVAVQMYGEVWRWGRWCAGCALALWALAICMHAGMFVERLFSPPWWVSLPLLLGLPWAFRSGAAAWAFGLWALVLSTAVFAGLGRWLPLALVRDHVVAAAMVCTGLAWFAGLAAFLGPHRVASDAGGTSAAGTGRAGGFDLQQHLDSPTAQEGADKTTRE